MDDRKINEEMSEPRELVQDSTTLDAVPEPTELEANEVEMADPSAESEASSAPKQPDRRQTFQTLGVLLVWYYIYQLFKGLFVGEITGNERLFAIVAVALMTVANLWLSVHLGKRYWTQYKENRDARDR